ncbi:hypothetical protein MPSI1_003397 [Malassezia psittaci]|uniref:Uncharacterized protein n=1 Tax=Malassezia psittaci TaxID=1821823 RepID=A0AAF0JF47_9BASI|nr:hypothetical protein MPSI1_003397 [Malassezia psittaci]
MPKRCSSRVPHSLEACMDAGVDQEERGERFAFGDKARRHYEAAYALYRQGTELAADSPDAWYNAARVQYILGSTLYWPKTAHDALTKALELYATALCHTTQEQSSVPSATRLDILSNMAYAFQALADLQDTYCYWTDEMRNRVQQALNTLQFNDQELSFSCLYLVALRLLESTEQGQMAVVQPMFQSQDATTASFCNPISSTASLEFTSSLVAPSSLLETYNDQMTCAKELISQANHDTLADAFKRALEIEQRASSYETSIPSPIGAQQSPEGEWEDQCRALHWSSFSVQIAAAQRAFELAQEINHSWPTEANDIQRVVQLQQQVQQYASETLASPPIPESMTSVRSTGAAQHDAELQVERLCDIADHAQSLAPILIYSHLDKSLAWDLMSCGTRCLLAAASALKSPATSTSVSASSLARADAPSAWIPRKDARPVKGSNSSTQVSRTRSSISLSLAQLALLRTHPRLRAEHSAAAETHIKSLANARVYLRHALLDHGAGWLIQMKPLDKQQEAEPMIYGRALAHIPPDGWEAMAQHVDMLLLGVHTLALTIYERLNHEQDCSALFSEINAWSGGIWSLYHGNAPVWSHALEPDSSVHHLFDTEVLSSMRSTADTEETVLPKSSAKQETDLSSSPSRDSQQSNQRTPNRINTQARGAMSSDPSLNVQGSENSLKRGAYRAIPDDAPPSLIQRRNETGAKVPRLTLDQQGEAPGFRGLHLDPMSMSRSAPAHHSAFGNESNLPGSPLYLRQRERGSNRLPRGPLRESDQLPRSSSPHISTYDSHGAYGGASRAYVPPLAINSPAYHINPGSHRPVLKHPYDTELDGDSSSLQPGSNRAQFLSLFSNFYDSLSDSRTLKATLEHQIHASNTLLQTLQRSNQVLEDSVDRRIRQESQGLESRFSRLEYRLEQIEQRMEEALRRLTPDSPPNHEEHLHRKPG